MRPGFRIRAMFHDSPIDVGRPPVESPPFVRDARPAKRERGFGRFS
jgi:hypothetical protein